MPKILLVKTSSLGDVVHNLPVVTDIHSHIPNASVDWVVEEAFADIPALHPGVHEVIPVAVRRWRKSYLNSPVHNEIASFRKQLTACHYDYIVDTQGLIKSAIITRLAHGQRFGYAWDSAREPLASLFYNRTFHVRRDLHAVARNRLLVGQALNYQPGENVDYGVCRPSIAIPWLPTVPYAVLLHATSRTDKQWQDANWLALGKYFNSIGITCILPWGDEAEHAQSQLLAAGMAASIVPPRLSLNEVAVMLGGARIVVGVDTGIVHLAAAMNIPVVAIFCASNPDLTGVYTSGPALNLGKRGKAPSVDEVIAASQKVLAA